MLNVHVNPIRILVVTTAIVFFLIAIPIARAKTNPAFSGITASADNATTAYYNPAGLTRTENTQIVGLVSIGYGIYQYMGVAPEHQREQLAGIVGSFRPLTDRERKSFTVIRLTIVAAKKNETIDQLSTRTGSVWLKFDS